MDICSRQHSAGVGREVEGPGGQSLRGPGWWDSAALEKQELRTTLPLSHSTTGSDCLSLMGTTAQDEFRASPSLPALKKEKPAKIYSHSGNHEKIQSKNSFPSLMC